MDSLAVVIPVYNEEGIIGKVLEEWNKELNRLGIDFKMHIYNDGSKDNTLKIISDYAEKYDRIIVHHKENSGHGPTILLGYKENSNADWIFQTDSDDEIGPESFENIWHRRGGYDFLVGRRVGRKSPFSRRIVSLVSRVVVRLFYGASIYDVNVPYRLMRTSKFADTFNSIPPDTFAPNVIISGVASLKGYRIFEIPISHRERVTGEVSIKKIKLLKAAVKSFSQTIKYRFNALAI